MEIIGIEGEVDSFMEEDEVEEYHTASLICLKSLVLGVTRMVTLQQAVRIEY